ncbi:MAG: VPLPA-CTERM sorting domain-containing protein [Methylotenera sp.]|nr:VPLPA-CTERM sorting domain-containing protein [Methylotenera sp.]
MKKMLIAFSFMTAAISAQSATVTTVENDLSLSYNSNAVEFNANNDVTGDVEGFNGVLSALRSTVFTVEYLGKEAAHKNFFVQSGSNIFNTNNTMIGQKFTFNIAEGIVNFGFTDSNVGFSASNTGENINNIYYLFGSDFVTTGSFLVGFNDRGSDIDADDLVVRVSAVSAVPVPAALPLLATAFGAFGIVRRRNKAKAV